jgi:hypothetical protein
MWQDRRLLTAIKELPPEVFLPLLDGDRMLRRLSRAVREAAEPATGPARAVSRHGGAPAAEPDWALPRRR